MAEYREGQTATNPKTGQKIVFKGGQWVNAGGAAPEVKLTEDQGKVQDYARQMVTAEQQYIDARNAGYDPRSLRNGVANSMEQFEIPFTGAKPLAPFASAVRDDPSDRGIAAQRAWLDARLKAMTGAGQSGGEAAENPLTYFPQPGEGASAMEPKYNIRREAYKSARVRSGPAAAALPERYPNAFAAGAQAAKSPAARTGQPVRVSGPEEGRRLAPGTRFITPDGQVRTRR